MKKIRRNLVAHSLLALGLSLFIYSTVQASVTKVGNGNDGADLEVLTPITSGPIFESRKHAIKLLERLNIVGIPGLGLLIPELERTDLLLASKNVHPTGEQKGSVEISEDLKLVYARTFAEPYAATRFFPAAKTLTSDQLVALQIHEALHRALPQGVRENENAVMHFTMAITSPGANFDRIHQVAGIYLPAAKPKESSEKVVSLVAPTPKVILSLPSPTSLEYQVDSYSDGNYGFGGSPIMVHGLDFTTSLFGYKNFYGYAVEPVFRARFKFSEAFQSSSIVGASSFDLETRVLVDQSTVAGPFIRFTTKSLDEARSYGVDGTESSYGVDDRDLFTLGGFYRIDQYSSYINTTFGFSLPSASKLAKYESIYSLTMHAGYYLNGLKIGGLVEAHSTEGRQVSGRDFKYYSTDAFRLLLVGPEINYEKNDYQLKAYFKGIVNNSIYTLDELGDLMDHGARSGGLGLALAKSW